MSTNDHRHIIQQPWRLLISAAILWPLIQQSEAHQGGHQHTATFDTETGSVLTGEWARREMEERANRISVPVIAMPVPHLGRPFSRLPTSVPDSKKLAATLLEEAEEEWKQDAWIPVLYTPPTGNGTLMAASFAPLQPNVRTYWDSTYFYVESDNMPDRTMMPNLMVGITAWQQQIPLPTSYFFGTTNPENNTGSLGYGKPNVWRLPLVPALAASPISLNGNFLRGAVAVAANGIAIFNPRNNRGEYSYSIGELDAYGGHCGLADDYHYHIAPVHLQSVVGADKPVAWALDGYPIFGFNEPDGSPQQPLDADGGHSHGSQGYHYHARGTAPANHVAPFLMDAMHGTVVNFGGQVDPQPEVQSMRPSGTGGYEAKAIAGAAITAFMNPVAFTVDGSGHFVHNPAGVASPDQYLMRYTVSGTAYDICWRINRAANPKTLTITFRTPATGTTTTTYTNGANNRLKAYAMAPSSMAKLPDTGATQSGTATFGEDADYTINPPSFTDNGNGTITDNNTGLMWQKVDNGESTWDAAVTNAAALTLGGFTDWRLPTPAEAFSILNHANSPAVNFTYFPSHAAGAAEYWWTSDIFGTDATRIFCTNSGGGIGPHPKAETLSAGGTKRFHARYVRGAKPTNGHHYTNNGDSTITDTDTGLMWTQTPSAAMNWNAAISYAEGLTTGTYTDWRLPNVKELQSLVDITLATSTSSATALPCLQRTLFPAATATACWSSTPLRSGGTPTQAWLVEFGVNTAISPPRGAQGIVSYEPFSSSYPVFAVRNAAATIRSISQGRATTTTANLLPAGQRVSAVGSITATDGTVWTVPAATQFTTGTKAGDLYNDVTGVTPASITAASAAIASAPTVVVDSDGEVITGYIFADNYFELYVNGTLVGIDPVPYTPFNSCFVKFRAKRPITYAFKLVDWEENLGLGTELNGGNAYYPGDGGLMASFSDGTVTNGNWKAQAFNIAPLDNPALVIEQADGTHDSTAATAHTLTETAYALHYPVPADWYSKTFADSGWPAATTYTEATVGVNNKPAYTNFPAQFSTSGAQFIWSSNLVLDNEVVVRYTGPAPVLQIGVEQGGSTLTDGGSTVAWGSVTVGSPVAKTFTIHNNGTTPLTIGGITFDGTGAASFSLGTSPAASVAAGSTTTFSVLFTPSTVGAQTAALHIASSDPGVGAGFDIALSGTGTAPPPAITEVRATPNTPTYADSVFVTARLQVATGATLTRATLHYIIGGAETTSTVFAETMAATAVTPWTGTGANNQWTITSLSGGNAVRQVTAANHGTGNLCGLQFDKGDTILSNTMAGTANTINATGTAGYVEFWLGTSAMIPPNGWTFQLSTDGTNWTTRLSELTGSNHAMQLYHYDLLPGERVSTLKMRFQFTGYPAVAPTPAPKCSIDDITVVTTTGSPLIAVTMLDDGLHSDGLPNDGQFGGTIPVQSAGTVVNYTLTATDNNNGTTTTPNASYTVSAVTPPANFVATAHISGPDVIVQWPAQSGISYSVQWSEDLMHWNNVPVGQTGRWTDTGIPAPVSKRFYRVVR